jgi:hypothetical protein
VTSCPFPDPSSLDDDGLVSINATLASFHRNARRVYEENPNPVTKWLMMREALASDYVTQLVAFRFGRAIDRGELEQTR